MKSYLDLLDKIVLFGLEKAYTRAEDAETASRQKTVGLSNVVWQHDLATGFPLLTTRRMPWQGIVGELRAFLDGCTRVEEFRDRGCRFWDPWARPDGSLGPIYGAQWRAHGQLDWVLSALRKGGTDRRMVVSAWRPDEHRNMALPPCHVTWGVSVYGGALSLTWFQRSADFPLGVPCNIASYALLAELLAAWGGFKARGLCGVFLDAHVYERQIDGVETLLGRNPGRLPTVDVKFWRPDDFFSWDVFLHDYRPQPPISFGEPEV